MNLTISQIKHIHSIISNTDELDKYAESLVLSSGEMIEHYELAEQGVGLTETQYDAIFNKHVFSKEYTDIRNMVEMFGDTISDLQWPIFADNARSLPAVEIQSMQNDPLFSGMYGHLSEISAERGIW